MDEYLSEKEQIERIRQWWRENGWYLLGGMAVAALGYVGYNQYREYQNNRAEQAAVLYTRLQQAIEDDRPGADDVLAELEREYPSSAYADQARLLMARKLLISDTAQAVANLREVMENSKDPGLALIARLRLARVLTYQESYAEALEVLEVDDAGDFAARLNELKGDIYAAMGDTEAARTAYTQALTAAGAENLNRNFVQMKLNDLPLPKVQLAPAEG